MEETVLIMIREFLKEDKEKVFDLMKEINEYDGNFEGADDIGRICCSKAYIKRRTYSS